jgi:hypothetical protein
LLKIAEDAHAEATAIARIQPEIVTKIVLYTYDMVISTFVACGVIR